MVTAATFVAAAVVGTLARAEAGRRWNRRNGIVVGTLVVNVTGSFLLGLLSEATPTAMTVLGVGGLGAFTTFSSFAHDAVALVELRRLAAAAVYVGAALVLGVAAAGAGVAIAHS